MPVEGVRGSLLLKSPEQEDTPHQLILMAALHGNSVCRPGGACGSAVPPPARRSQH